MGTMNQERIGYSSGWTVEEDPEGGFRLGPQPARIEEVLGRTVAWARQQPDIRGLALVGSWARGGARADSDVDLVVLTSRRDRYLEEDGWTAALGSARVLRTEAWGPLTERRLLL